MWHERWHYYVALLHELPNRVTALPHVAISLISAIIYATFCFFMITPTASHMTSSSRTLSMHRLRLAPHPHSFLLPPHHHQPPYRSLSTSMTSQRPHRDH